MKRRTFLAVATCWRLLLLAAVALGGRGQQGMDAGEVSGPEYSWSIFLTVAVFAVRLLFSSSFHPAPNVYVLENSESHARAPLDFLEAIADGLVACSPPFLRARPFCFGGSPGG